MTAAEASVIQRKLAVIQGALIALAQAQILEAHSRHFERMEDALIGMGGGIDDGFSRVSQRMDRLTTAIARGRAQDLARLDEHDRRIHGLEKARHSRKR